MRTLLIAVLAWCALASGAPVGAQAAYPEKPTPWRGASDIGNTCEAMAQ